MNRQAGYSLIEALVAAALLLVIALGLIPLFARSIDNNSVGSDYSQATMHAKTDLEGLQKMPFHNAGLELDAGVTTLQDVRYVERGIQRGTPVTAFDWELDPAAAEPVLWTRTTGLRQFSISAFDDGVLDDDEALPGGTPDHFVQVKELTVSMDSGKVDPGRMAAIGRVTFQLMKPF